MRAASPRSLVLLATLALAGCSSRDCADVDCLDGAGVLFTGAAKTFSDDLPVTLTVCIGSACSSFRLEETGQAPVCTTVTGGTSICTIDDLGTVVLTALPFPAGTAAGALLPIHATVTDETGTLYDSTQTVAVTAPAETPGCVSTCDSAEASFTPP